MSYTGAYKSILVVKCRWWYKHHFGLDKSAQLAISKSKMTVVFQDGSQIDLPKIIFLLEMYVLVHLNDLCINLDFPVCRIYIFSFQKPQVNISLSFAQFDETFILHWFCGFLACNIVDSSSSYCTGCRGLVLEVIPLFQQSATSLEWTSGTVPHW